MLFPGGPLPLRIFEPRYIDMVRRCMREQQPFGVVLIRAGDEAGAVASTATSAARARIVDFHSCRMGCSASAAWASASSACSAWRASRWAQHGRGGMAAGGAGAAAAGDYAHLADDLRRVLPSSASTTNTSSRRFDDAAWVGARLAELLPIELAEKQACSSWTIRSSGSRAADRGAGGMGQSDLRGASFDRTFRCASTVRYHAVSRRRSPASRRAPASRRGRRTG